MAEKLQVLVEGGKVTPGPPLGPALGPLGVNVVQIISQLNEKTKEFMGMKVPVTLIIDPKTKDCQIIVGTPPTSALIVKELGIEKGSGKSKTEVAGNLTMKQVIKIAKMKKDSILGKTLKKMAMEVVGTCVSMGVNVESKDPREMQKLINQGFYNDLLIEK